jgi:biopolymer transport protein ExbB
MIPFLAATQAPSDVPRLDSVTDMILAGGPVMIPLSICSIAALAYVVERWIRLRDTELGTREDGKTYLNAFATGGAAGALERCQRETTPFARVFAAGMRKALEAPAEVERTIEEAGAREAKRLGARLRPLVVIGMIAPLLGLLGTILGMIQCFYVVAIKNAMGRPELLASGISQALITTAAGLFIAIPAQAAYYWFRSRIERFARRIEDTYSELEPALSRARLAPGLAPGLPEVRP